MNIKAPASSNIPALRKLWKEAFSDSDEFLNLFFSTAFEPNRCRCLMIENNLIAALYWFNCSYGDKPIAYLYAVATASSHRGHGFCHKLLEDTHQYLKKLGYEGVILVPGTNQLFEFYQGMGYQTCCYRSEFQCQSVSGNIDIRRIEQYEYATLRRQLLPQGSVIQEKENLDFLETQAIFYAGDDFLLAAHGEADVLCGIELLGNLSVAPKLLHALGYSQGTFRTSGSEIPFAMFFSLGNSFLTPPSYFGFAFD